MKQLIKTISTFSKQLQRDNIGAYAASMSFFFILSIVPTLLIACRILTYLPVTERTLFETIERFLPGFLDSILSDVLNQANEQYQSILPIAIIVLLWSAGKAVWGMMMGLNTANKVTETRNVIFVRIISSFYAIIMMFVIIACLLVILLSEKFALRVRHFLPKITSVLINWGNARFIAVWVILALFLAFLYTFIPNTKLKYRYQLPGACFAALGWSVFSWGFSIYVDNFDSFNIYGSLSTLILIMIWMYTCMYMLLIGANINRFFNKQIEEVIGKKSKILKK